MRTLLLSLFINIILFTNLHAGEGMWLPLLLEQLNETEMQAMGMKMSAEDIYSVNQGSLKDAIVHFGGFCTGEVISSQGLVLTNHHCGYRAIQSHSSVGNDYLQDGFWASNQSEELINENLFVTFIISMADVTEAVLANLPKVTGRLSKKEAPSMLQRSMDQIKANIPHEDYQEVIVKSFFNGNQYFAFVTEKYTDIRLVGAPPSSIGKFGADTDNWEFPRHTGDFSLFRIYTSRDGKPAKPSADNIPMVPRHHLPISLDGVEVNDFTLIFGFPSKTQEYLPAVAVDHKVNIVNPIRIGIRSNTLAIINNAMRKSDQTRIQYASKQASIANGWKKWKGENKGIAASSAIAKKKTFETTFQAKIAEDPILTEKYGGLLEQFDKQYSRLKPFAESREYIGETIRNVEIFKLSNSFKKILRIYKRKGFAKVEDRVAALSDKLTKFYKNYDPEIDKKIMISLMTIYFNRVEPSHQSQYAKDQLEFAGGDVKTLITMFLSKSALVKGDLILDLLEKNPEGFLRQIAGDPILQLSQRILEDSKVLVFTPYDQINKKIKALQQQYMAGLLTVFPDQKFYPDANGTMRVSYGKVEGYDFGNEHYGYSTYLDGVIEKYVPGDYEFDVPAKLRQLHKRKNYGEYADANGKMPVCFIGSNHTTGGNSGSPVIDAHGNFVGINFDRTWHSTMSDMNYDASICRNIMVDARYILFIIDKFAGAGYLVDEMTLVHPKKG